MRSIPIDIPACVLSQTLPTVGYYSPVIRRSAMTTTGTGTSLPAALRHLAGYTATTAVATGAELAKATTDALSRRLAGTPYRRRTPLDAASGALRWVAAVTDRRPPDWHTPNR